jgi:DNA replication protein DnaC
MKKEEIIRLNQSITSCAKDGIIHMRGQTRYLQLASDRDDAKEKLIRAIPLVDFTIKKLEWLPEYDQVCEWLTNPKKGLLLLGDSGRLKTVIATLVIPVLYFNSYNLKIVPIKSRKIISKMNDVMKHPVVIVDDVGEEPTANEFGTRYEPFSELVDECERLSKILIITTNLNSEQLTRRYGGRPVDRLDVLCEPVVFKGKSFR